MWGFSIVGLSRNMFSGCSMSSGRLNPTIASGQLGLGVRSGCVLYMSTCIFPVSINEKLHAK